MAVENQTGPTGPVSHATDDAESAITMAFDGMGRVSSKSLEVEVPHVDVEPDPIHQLGHPFLGRGLVPTEARMDTSAQIESRSPS